MYRTYRAEIDRVERGFGVSIDGQQARPNRIAQANRDYPEIVHGYGAVRSISESLASARDITLVFAQSPRGESFLEQGRQRLAQQEPQTPEAADQMVGPD